MTHREIEQQDVIERYVRGQLSVDERAAFQDHFFACDECFDRLQVTERFVAGVRHASETGILARGSAATSETYSWFGWFKPAFLLPTAVALLLAIAIGWLLLFRMPAMREQLARERQAREQSQQESRQKSSQAEEQLQREKDERTKLESQLAQQSQKSAPQSTRPSRSANAPGNELARKPATAPSETETSEAEATRSTNARNAGASLAEVKRIYVEAVVNENLSRQTRDLMIAKLKASTRVSVIDNKEEADAVLKLSVTQAASKGNQIKLSARLVNVAGTVIWPTSGKLRNYQGSTQDTASKLVRDLLRDVGREIQKR
jgi:Putative zinc-finger